MLDLQRSNQNRAARLHLSGEVLQPRNFLNRATVCHKYSDFVFVVPIKMVVQRFSPDFTANAFLTVLAPKQNHFTSENKSRLWGRKPQLLTDGLD